MLRLNTVSGIYAGVLVPLSSSYAHVGAPSVVFFPRRSLDVSGLAALALIFSSAFHVAPDCFVSEVPSRRFGCN